MSLKTALMDVLTQIDGCCLDTEEERQRACDHVMAWMHTVVPTPLYPHDRDCCLFAGQVVHEHHGLCDVYECPAASASDKRVFGATIVARYGPGPEEYASMDEKILEKGLSPKSVLRAAHALVVARREVHPPEVLHPST